MHRLTRLLGAGAVLWFAGCANPQDPAASVQRLSRSVAARTGADIHVPQSQADRADAESRVHALLAHALTPESAVAVALLNNRDIRATFAEVGISQTELISAGLIGNPSISVTARWPHESPRGPNLDFGLSAALLDLAFRPMRQRLAGDDLAQTERRVVHELLALVSEVRSAVFAALAEQALQNQLELRLETAAASLDLSQRQYDAGNISELALLEAQSDTRQKQLQKLQADARVTAARERLNLLLGLNAAQIAWTLAGDLPALPAADNLPDNLEETALDHRLDLAVARGALARIDQTLELEQRARRFPGARIGLEAERESDGAWKSGPSLEFELPFFDRGQGTFARLAIEQQQARDRVAALEAQIGSQIRMAHAQLRAARAAAEYHDNVLRPHQRALLHQQLLHYNAMQHSVPELLAAKETELQGQSDSVEALLSYWQARVALETALGTALPPPDAITPDSSAETEPVDRSPRHSHQP